MSFFTQNPVSKVVWNWQRALSSPSPQARPIRSGLRHAFLMGMVAALFFFFTPFRLPIYLLAGLAVLIVILSAIAPRVFLRIQSIADGFGRMVGTILTWALLAPFYYLVFTPGRIALALRGKDPMQRGFDADQRSYWVKKPPRRPGATWYRKQF